MKPFETYIYPPYKWIIAFPFIFLATMFLSLVAIFTGLIFSPDAADRVAKLWAKLCCGVVPFRIKLKGEHHYTKDKAYVVVANHQSSADIPAIHARLGLNIKWVMKKELQKIPLFGTACHQLGCIYVNRSNHDEAIHSIQQAKETLSRTACPFFFAEGTRSLGDRVLPFKKGAFNYALDTGIPLLPVTIKNTAVVLPPGSLDLKPGTIELVVHRPIETKNFPKNQIEQLMENTRQIIASAL